MIILACSDHKIQSRWKKSLVDFNKTLITTHISSLKNKLRNVKNALVILHTSLPGLTSDKDIIGLLTEFPGTRMLALADIPNEHQGIELIRSGVLGYANSHIKPDILHEAIKVIELGEIWVSKRLLQWLINHCHESGSNTSTGSFLAIDVLTPSEKHVAKHLANGNNNKQIAQILNITERTVKAHLTSIYSKTGVKDRLHLALLVHNNSQV